MQNHFIFSGKRSESIFSHWASFLRPAGRGNGPRTLAPRASQRLAYTELTRQVIFVIFSFARRVYAKCAATTESEAKIECLGRFLVSAHPLVLIFKWAVGVPAVNVGACGLMSDAIVSECKSADSNCCAWTGTGSTAARMFSMFAVCCFLIPVPNDVRGCHQGMSNLYTL